jgi:SAM-dependent methyltransferase
MCNRKGASYGSLRLDVEQSRRMSEMTIAYYDRMAETYWDGTRDHDVSQNYTALLDAIETDPPYSILDLGCGPGRDLRHFRSLGHNAVGLDGSKEFVAMARSYSGCDVLHQDFLAMALPESRFDGVFANASPFLTQQRMKTTGLTKLTSLAFPMMFNDASWKVPRHKWFCGRQAAVWTTVIAGDCRRFIVLGSRRGFDTTLPLLFRASIKF